MLYFHVHCITAMNISIHTFSFQKIRARTPLLLGWEGDRGGGGNVKMSNYYCSAKFMLFLYSITIVSNVLVAHSLFNSMLDSISSNRTRDIKSSAQTVEASFLPHAVFSLSTHFHVSIKWL